MKHIRWINVIFGCVVLVMVITRIGGVLAIPIFPLLDPSVYLPIVIKEEMPTPTGTSTPTPTLTGTPTPISTATPTPTQTSLPTGLYVLQNHSYYVTPWDSLHIVGEVMNNTDNHLFWVKVSVNFFNSGGQLVGTDYAYTDLDTLPAGNKTCFHIIVIDPPVDWSYYQFETPTYFSFGQPLPNLTVLNDSGIYDPNDGDYKIVGQVRNDHGSRVEYVSPVGTLYNASGTVVGCDYTYVNSTDLDPGQISAFQIDYYGRDYIDVASYSLQVDGNP